LRRVKGCSSCEIVEILIGETANQDYFDFMSKPSLSKNPACSYPEYLQLEKLLSCQNLESVGAGRPAHDEMLFIIIHQLYELWFKQILHDLDSVMKIFSEKELDDSKLGICSQRLERITKIQSLMIAQIEVLETMTPMDFLDFRDLLFPASGFQSFQFRLVENKLGLKRSQRLPYDGNPYVARLSAEEAVLAQQSENQPTLFQHLQSWLERTPFVQTPHFKFWDAYRVAVDEMLNNDEATIKNNAHLNDQAKIKQLDNLKSIRESFELLLNEEKFPKLKEKLQWSLSFKATSASLFIFLYRDEPALQLPFKLLTLVTSIDENFTAWRQRHTQMAMRMIGTKIGTGGSSGAEYLQASTLQHKVFQDFSRLSTFLIPRRSLPELPADIKASLKFHYAAV